MHLPRRSLLTTAMALCLAAAFGSPAIARTPDAASNPVTNGFQPHALAFFDADHGIVAGTIVCPACTAHRTAAISTTGDGGQTWSSPTTFHAAMASAVTVVPDGTNAWAIVGTRLQHSADGGTTWSVLPKSGVTDPSFADAMNGWAIRRTTVSSGVVASADGGTTWIAGPTPCHSGAREPLSVTRTTIDDGWAVCGGSAGAGSLVQVVWKTTDGGTTWERGFHGVAPSAAGYLFLDDGHGWRWHYAFADLFRTTDGGTIWHDLGSVGDVFLEDVWFVSNTNGTAIVQRPNESWRLLTSSDGGVNWSDTARFPAS